jgi:membrane protein
MEAIRALLNRVMRWFSTTIWLPRQAEESAARRLLIRLLRTAIVAGRGFSRHQGSLRASALTFYTLLSLVPVAAMAFGIATGFGFERRLQRELLERFAAQQEVLQRIFLFAQNMLANTKGGIVAGIGVIVLFWAAVKLLGNIEHAFNHIWGVRSRTWVRMLSDYLSIMLVCPLLIILSGSLTVFIASQVTAISDRFGWLQMAGPIIHVGLQLLPYMLIWVLFTLVYLILPNTRVSLDSALLAGVVAGSAYQILQATYIHLQIVVATYNVIYGSFAALPLFLLWLQISWLIVLIGAEIAYAYQHADQADQRADGRGISISRTRLAALTICRHVVHRFHQGRAAQTPEQIAAALAFSPTLVDYLCDLLVKGGMLVRIEPDADHAKALQPAIDIGRLTVNRVLSAVEDVSPVEEGPPPHLTEAQALSDTLEQFRSELDRSASNRLLLDL